MRVALPADGHRATKTMRAFLFRMMTVYGPTSGRVNGRDRGQVKIDHERATCMRTTGPWP